MIVQSAMTVLKVVISAMQEGGGGQFCNSIQFIFFIWHQITTAATFSFK